MSEPDRGAPPAAGLAQTLGDAVPGGELPLALSEPRLAIAGGASGERFEVREMIGAGSSGRVWRVFDRELGREVAVKSLAPGTPADRAESFLREARIAAAIEHPNVVPVYDVSVTDLGQVWFAMKRVEGQPLDEAIAAAAEGSPPAPIATLNQRVTVVLQVCNAMQAAHARGYQHRDIKPANIMLGRFGEVLVVDWGTASEGATPGRGAVVGTPLYMSPEQARGEEGGVPGDIHALGATLFELLTLRPPLLASTPEAFWRRKRAGEIDPPTAEERARVPRHLLAIALKAMAPQPAERYATVASLADDLSRYQAGQAISACRDTVGEWLARAHRRHGRRLWLATMLLALAGLAGAMIYGDHLARLATWGQPVFSEDFADDGWKRRWEVLEGGWENDDGWLVSTGRTSSILWLPQRFSGPTAIEYEGLIRPGSLPCDISLLWARSPQYDKERTARLGSRLVKCLVGAFDGNFTTIVTEHDQNLASSDVHPVAGRIYRVRIEVVDDSIAIALDGVEVCRWRDSFPLVGGHIALYGFYAGKAFRNLRVYSLGVPARPLATAVGDAFAQRGAYVDAAEEYARVVISQPRESELGLEAAYRQGLCLERAGRHEAADAAWRALDGTPRADEARLHRLARDFSAGARQPVIDGLVELARLRRDPDFHAKVAGQWATCMRTLVAGIRFAGQQGVEDDLDALLALRDPWFRDDRQTDRDFGEALCLRGRFSDILELLPRQHGLCARSLRELGRPDEVEQRYPEQRGQLVKALIDMGEYERVERDFPEVARPVERFDRGLLDGIPPTAGDATFPLGGHALIFQGRLAEALAAWPGNPAIHAAHLLHGGDRAALIAGLPDHVASRILTGGAEERMADAARPGRETAAAWLAVDALARGDRAAALSLVRRAAALRTDPRWVFDLDLLLPLIADAADGGQRVEALIVDWSGRGWRDRHRFEARGRYLGGLIDDAAFLAQPVRLLVAGELVLLRAVRADRAGRREEAVADYRRWLALPTWQRTWELDLPAERWAQWRIETLQVVR